MFFFLLPSAQVLLAQDSIPVVQEPKIKYSENGRDIIEVHEEVTFLEETNGLPLDIGGNPRDLIAKPRPSIGLRDLSENENRGIRIFRVMLKPHETLKATLKVMDSSKVRMLLGLSKGDDPGQPQIQKINRAQKILRKQFIEFKNPTDQPYPLILHLTGFARYSYRVDLERS
ncbi:MAG: hypothetical protein Q8O00_00140 [Holophaga sp.]|nr:hypothetical protein [Holophaga sp.]